MLDLENKDHLILLNKILSGEIVLFTGAGFSLGATNIKNEPIPSVNELKKILIENILKFDSLIDPENYNEFYSLNLQDLCDECEEVNNSEFQKILSKSFKIKSPKEFHIMYGEIKWKRIYTLNIDDLLEHILENNNVDYISLENPRPQSVNSSERVLYKLRGSVRNSGLGYTFSKLSYNKNLIASQKDIRFYNLINDFETENILFIGTSMTDEIDIDLEILKNKSFISNRFYYVSPSISAATKKILSRKFSNIIFIEETAQTFIEKFYDYKNKVNPNFKISFKEEIDSNTFQVINKELYFDNTYLSPNMYIGNDPTWTDIFTNHDVILDITEELITSLPKILENNTMIITDKSISGKTTLLLRLGAYLSNDYLVLQYRGDNLYKDLHQLIKLIEKHIFGEKIIVLVDDADWILGNILELSEMINNYKIFIFCTVRETEYQKKFYILTEEERCAKKIIVKNNIRTLTLNDAHKFILKLSEKSYLGKYAGMPIEKASELFLNKQKQSDILQSLYEFKNGEYFKSRISVLIKNELKENINLKRFVLLLYALDEFGNMGIKLKIFFEFFQINTNSNFLSLINEFISNNLEPNQVNKNTVVKSRYNTLLATAIKEMPNFEKREIIEDILIYLSNNYYHELKNSKSYQSHIMYQLLRSQNLSNILTSGKNTDWEEIFILYKNLHTFYEDFTTYWLHRAISEIKYGIYDDAEIHITQAESIRKSFEIEHTKSVLYLERALNEKNLTLDQRINYFNKGLEILNNQIQSPLITNDAYSFHTYIVKACQFYKKHKYQPTSNELKIMISYYQSAKHKYGLDSVIIRNILRKLFSYLQCTNQTNILSLNQQELRILTNSKENLTKLEEDLIVVTDETNQ